MTLFEMATRLAFFKKQIPGTMEFITQSPPLLKAFWYLAIFSTTVFVGLMALTFGGGGDMDDADFDTEDGHGSADFKTFTFRNLMNFLLGFSWTGVALYPHVDSMATLLVLSVAVGAWMVWFLWKMMQAVVALGSDQTILNEDFIGQTGQVYLTIPGGRKGRGKVLVSIGGSMREFDAMTEGAAIENGRTIQVMDVVDGAVLLVNTLVP